MDAFGDTTRPATREAKRAYQVRIERKRWADALRLERKNARAWDKRMAGWVDMNEKDGRFGVMEERPPHLISDFND